MTAQIKLSQQQKQKLKKMQGGCEMFKMYIIFLGTT